MDIGAILAIVATACTALGGFVTWYIKETISRAMKKASDESARKRAESLEYEILMQDWRATTNSIIFWLSESLNKERLAEKDETWYKQLNKKVKELGDISDKIKDHERRIIGAARVDY